MFAVKIITKGHASYAARLRREVEMMKMMDHPNVVKLHETFEDKNQVSLVMELCDGGELFDRVATAVRLTESEGKVVMRQVFRTVSYLHENNIAHRDLKLENFLLTRKGPIEGNVLKLIDFGAACHSPVGKIHMSLVGTTQYMAPQVLMKSYDRSCDLWSCGVIMYTLLKGQLPFYGTTREDTVSRVCSGSLSLSGSVWAKVSEAAKQLVRRLLNRAPAARPLPVQALEDAWLATPHKSGCCPKVEVIAGLRNLAAEPALQRAALHVIADNLREEETTELKRTFDMLDPLGSGVLKLPQLCKGVEQSDVVPDLKCIMAHLDTSGAGIIEYTSFLAATMDRKRTLTRDNCWIAFAAFDVDNDNVISQKDLKRVFGATVAQCIEQELRLQSIHFEAFLKLLGAGCAGGKILDDYENDSSSVSTYLDSEKGSRV